MPAVPEPPWETGTWAETVWAANVWGIPGVVSLDLGETVTRSLMPTRTIRSQMPVRTVRALGTS